MTNAILLRSCMSRKAHVQFWSRVGRSDPPGLGNRILQLVPENKNLDNL